MSTSTPSTTNTLTNPIIAINQAKIANRPESYATMMKVGPKVCITTASHPGFLGFEQLIQRGQQLGASGLIERGPILLR